MRPISLRFLSLLVFLCSRGVAPAQEPPQLELVLQTTWHAAPVAGVALSGDGKHVVIAGAKTVFLWGSATGKKLRIFQGHTDYVTSVALSGDGRQVVTGSNDRTAVLWEVASGKKRQTFRGHAGQVTSLAFSGDGKRLWTVSADRSIRLWDPVTDKERCRLYSLNSGEGWLVVTPEGRFDGSKDAWRFVAYRQPGTLELLNDDDARKQFHRPGLLAQVWKGAK